MDKIEELIKAAAASAANSCFKAELHQRQAIIENAIRKVLMEDRNNAAQSS